MVPTFSSLFTAMRPPPTQRRGEARNVRLRSSSRARTHGPSHSCAGGSEHIAPRVERRQRAAWTESVRGKAQKQRQRQYCIYAGGKSKRQRLRCKRLFRMLCWRRRHKRRRCACGRQALPYGSGVHQLGWLAQAQPVGGTCGTCRQILSGVAKWAWSYTSR